MKNTPTSTMKPTLPLLAALLLAPLAPLHSADDAKPIPLKKSPITNCWGDVKPVKIPVDNFIVFKGKIGLGYNHQPQLTTHQGRLIATWTMGVRDEEGPGEDVVFSVSDDQGKTWSPARVIKSAQPGRAAKTIEVSTGIRSFGDTMVAYSGHWDRAPEGIQPDGFRTKSDDPVEVLRDVRTEACVSDDGGKNWSTPVVVAPNITNYMTPFTTQSGRIILPGNLTFPWTDDPLGLTGWNWSGIPGLAEGVQDTYCNMHEINRLGKTGQLYNEACCYQLANGVLRMMLRNEQKPHRLGVCESYDNGITWTTPELTDYIDSVCRAHFGRLPDGRYFGMTCPNPIVLRRTPAILALSEDGNVFDKHYVIGDDVQEKPRYQGSAKGGRYGYPYLHVDGEYGYVIYSIYKEDIGVTRFRLDDLK